MLLPCLSVCSDNPMADIYGANLYNHYLQASHGAKGKKAKSGRGGVVRTHSLTEADNSERLSAEPGGASAVFGSEEELPEKCHSILVCTGVYSRDQEELLSDTTQTVTEQQIFHGHRDFHFDPSLTQPSFVVQDVKEAVEMVFQQEGWPLE